MREKVCIGEIVLYVILTHRVHSTQIERIPGRRQEDGSLQLEDNPLVYPGRFIIHNIRHSVHFLARKNKKAIPPSKAIGPYKEHHSPGKIPLQKPFIDTTTPIYNIDNEAIKHF